MGKRTAILLTSCLLFTACSDSGSGASSTPNQADATLTTTPPGTEGAPESSAAATTTAAAEAAPKAEPAPETTVADPAFIAALEVALEGVQPGCDPLDTRQCVLPYPSDATTSADNTAPTGKRVAFGPEALPANADGIRIDPTGWNRNDGFSPNSTLLTHIPNLDPTASVLPTWTDLGASLEPGASVVLVNATNGERIPLWAEPDPDAETPDDELLIIHPAVSLVEGHTYMVGIRQLVDTTGALIEPSLAMLAYRDRILTTSELIEARRDDMEGTFAVLQDAGVDRSTLQLAWSFTVASEPNITGRMLHIRDQTLAELGEDTPAFEITSVVDAPTLGLDGVARQISGVFTVANWLTGDGSPGNRFELDENDLPIRHGELTAPFVCNISDTTMTGTEPGRIVQYGHGLLGDETEIDASNVRAMSSEHNVVHCATKWAGMSADDVGNAVEVLGDLSNFPTMADRLQQGVLNQVVLGRLMLSDSGFVAQPAFQRDDGSLLIDNSRLAYDGNSQGGIMGLMLAAVSPDFERAVLGVPGMNYSLLLPRSVDFDTYEAVMVPAYPNSLDRMLAIAVLQMLWDRGEGAGYVRHVVSNPLANTNAKAVLLHIALGDHQVSEISAFVEARTMGIPIYRPIAAPGRSDELEPAWGLDRVDPATATSAVVVWDAGAEMIPFGATAPRSGEDPHEHPRSTPAARSQKAAFLFDEMFADVCEGGPCMAVPVDN